MVNVSFHPMAKLFSLLEAKLRFLWTLVEFLKTMFYYTSCQPNWSLVAKLFNVDNVGDHLKIVLPGQSGSFENNTEMVGDMLFIEPTLNCSVISKFSFLFYTAHLFFFFMTAVLRFYIIMVRGAKNNQETLTRPYQRVLFTLLGVITTSWMYLWRMDDQGAFTLACLLPNEERPPRISTRTETELESKVFFLSLVALHCVPWMFYMIMAIKVMKAPTITSISLVNTLTILDVKIISKVVYKQVKPGLLHHYQPRGLAKRI